MSLIVDEHREYLADGNRLDAYGRAIAETVKPGAIVVDLGAGTGILGLLACRAGARRVYAIEESSLIGLTREIYQANGFGDRVTFIKELSTHANIPELADVVLSDQIGQFGFDAGIFEYYSDARRRFLKPEGVLLPSRIDLHLAPVEREDLWRQIDFWNGSTAGFNFLPARALAANTGYPTKFDSRHLLAGPSIVASLATAQCPASITCREAAMEVERSGSLHGIGGWFSAQLSPGVTMSNGPLEAKPIRRRNVFFPIDRPIVVEKGDMVRVSMTIRPNELVVAWVVEVYDHLAASGSAPRARFTHSTFQGMLLCQEDLDRAQPTFAPTLTPRGQARRSILELCDGRRSLAEIEHEVYLRHPQLFHSSAEAAAFVGEVVTRYTE